jgi:diguanylate cyclase (GGDEF)-like protein
MSQAQPQPDFVVSPPTCGLALIGADGRIEWANDALAELAPEAPALEGLRPRDLPSPLAELLARTTRCVDLPDGRRLCAQHHVAGDKSLILLLDTSGERALLAENQRLRQQIEELKLSDDLTGLPNRRAITQALELQISRSRRYRNPLAVVLVHLAVDDEHIGLLREAADQLVLGVSRFLRDRLRWVDQIGRWEDNMFLLVLPETEEAHARGLVRKIQDEISGIELPHPLNGIQPLLGFGLGVWRKGDDLRTLLRSATQDLASG